MDLGTVVGFILTIINFVAAILIGGAGLLAYWDVPSVAIVFGGTFCCTIIKWPIHTCLSSVRALLKTIFFKNQDYQTTIDKMIELAEKARRESIFALEKVEIADPFIKKACNLAADNRPPEVINSILEMDLSSMAERHKNVHVVYAAMSEDAPAMGMTGTLIGLVAMLQNLSDPAAIGPGMAVALLTTMYGAMFANLFCLPIMKKLESRSQEEQKNSIIVITGILGIVAGENPRLIREKLNSFLAPTQRKSGEEEVEAKA